MYSTAYVVKQWLCWTQPLYPTARSAAGTHRLFCKHGETSLVLFIESSGVWKCEGIRQIGTEYQILIEGHTGHANVSGMLRSTTQWITAPPPLTSVTSRHSPRTEPFACSCLGLHPRQTAARGTLGRHKPYHNRPLLRTFTALLKFPTITYKNYLMHEN